MAGQVLFTSKGEQTRTKILRAAQRVIAEQGVGGASHRAIAAQAEVKLSLTSYYFGSLAELLEAAWDDHRARSAPYSVAMLTRMMEIFQELRVARTSRARARHVLALADHLASYIAQEARDRQLDLAIDCSFLFAWSLPDTLRQKVVAHNRLWVSRIAEQLRRVGSTNPDMDAQNWLAVARYCEFSQVTYGREVLGEAEMRQRFFCLLKGMLPNVGDVP
jgi:AcrR family transcriptional regulator